MKHYLLIIYTIAAMLLAGCDIKTTAVTTAQCKEMCAPNAVKNLNASGCECDVIDSWSLRWAQRSQEAERILSYPHNKELKKKLDEAVTK